MKAKQNPKLLKTVYHVIVFKELLAVILLFSDLHFENTLYLNKKPEGKT